jgi:iron complex outermembrane recepter protein
VFVARQNGNNLSLFDVDHVEVLRGPQGTLFGRNTTGGAVSIIYRKPAPALDGYVEAGFGEYSERFFRASVDVPLSATFLTKVSGFYIKDDGYVSNLTTGQTLNGNSDKGIRLAVRWLPSAAVTWDLAADYIDQEALNILNYPDSNNHRVSMTGLNTSQPHVRSA